MAEPIASAAPVLMSNVAAGVATAAVGTFAGLDPVVMVLGAGGAVSALSYADPVSFAKRLLAILTGTLFAAVGAPVVASILVSMPWAPSGLAHPLLSAALAVGIGYLSPAMLPEVRQWLSGRLRRETAKETGDA